MLDAAGVHHNRPGDHRNAATSRSDVLHHFGDAGHHTLDPALRRDVVVHERETEPVALLELGRHSYSLVAADHKLAASYVPQLATRRLVTLHDDDRVHPLLLHFDPASPYPHVRAVVRRRIEVVGDAAIFFRRLGDGVALAYGVTPENGELLEKIVEHRRVARVDAHLDVRGVVIRAPDVELHDLVGRPELDDLVEDGREQSRIDQVSFGFDGVAGSHAELYRKSEEGRGKGGKRKVEEVEKWNRR